MSVTVEGLEVVGPIIPGYEDILSPQALSFVARLQREFLPTREKLLQARIDRQAELDAGALPDFLPETKEIRDADWRINPLPKDLYDRRVEITGPVDRRMVINALNSGASVYMADFEDANAPNWNNVVRGQRNLIDAIEKTISLTTPEGREYKLNEKIATLLVRPRGWHLPEKHILLDGKPISGGLLDFGLYMFHSAKRLLAHGTGPYFYLPKLENHLEARLWNDAFNWAEDQLGLTRGTIKATVLVETILATFEMEEILYELREHSAGLNAGRWDYIFSIIKKFHDRPEFILPDRGQVTMGVPFMRAYAQQLVKICHKRGAPAIGGMAAYIPNRRNAELNEIALARVREDKVRESGDGFDGTWVAHPDLVPVAKEVFDGVLGDKPNQWEKQRPDVNVSAKDLLDVMIPGSTITEQGLRSNITVTIVYLESWLRGIGAVAINNLMEDVATSEISRSQVWQWYHHGVTLEEGQKVTRELVLQYEAEELKKVEEIVGADAFAKGRFVEAASIFEQVSLSDDFVQFLTLPAYDHIDL